MNAVNPVPSPASGAEPSMEEILASIRRIIADDQPPSAAPAPETPSQAPHSNGPTALDIAGIETLVDTLVESMPSGHGSVQAPQFATPEGPAASVMDTKHPLAPVSTDAASEPASAQAVALHEPDLHEASLRAMHEEQDARAAVVNAAHDHVYEGHVFEEPAEEKQARDLPASETLAHQPAAEEPPMDATGKTRDVPPHEPPSAGLFSAATSQSLASAFNTLAISRLADDSEQLRGLASEMMRPLLKDWLDAHLPGLVESIIREEIDRMARRTR